MKKIEIKRTRSSANSTPHSFVAPQKTLPKSLDSESRRVMSEPEFWKETALQQQKLLHAKNRT